MKKTRNLFFLVTLALITVMSSCDDQKSNEDTAPQQETTLRSRLARVNNGVLDTSNINSWTQGTSSNLPQSVKDYLDQNYAGIDIYELLVTDTGEFVILLENDIVAIFGASGDFILAIDLGEILGEDDGDDEDWEDIDPANLPQGILDYIASNYPDATIEEAGIDPETGDYIVILDSDICVIFDKDGNFIEVIEEDDFDDEDWTEVQVSDLPQVIQDYVASNYPDNTIDEAVKNNEDGEYIIFLDNGTILEFDKDGKFLEAYEDEGYEDDEIDIADLPDAIKTYVTDNYSGRTIEEAYYSSDDEEYYVILDDDTALVFDKDGKFIEEDTDD